MKTMANSKHVERVLSGEDVYRADLVGADLSSTDLTDAKLQGADLTNADLWRAKFIGAKLNGAKFIGAKLKRANLSFADLRRADLTNADLSHAKLIGAILTNAKLRKAILIDADLSSTDLVGADLTDADLVGADLSSTDLRDADLTDADLTDADLRKAKLNGADLSGAIGIPLSISDSFPHKGETVEEKARRETIQDITRRVSRAKKDKELEALAQEVGSLQAQPDYVREYENILEDLQGEIEKKYSVLGKGLNYLKKLFGRGKRASQIRIASQMNQELQREIRELKRDLDK